MMSREIILLTFYTYNGFGFHKISEKYRCCDNKHVSILNRFVKIEIYFYFFQKAGNRTTRAENISNLPTSIFHDKNHLLVFEKKA